MEREVGGGIGMGKTCKLKAVSFQCMTKFTTNLKKKKEKKKKEYTCNVGDPGSIPGLGISPGEEISYPLQYSWASFVAQQVKNLPAMRETWVQSLGWEDPLE